MIAAPSTGRWQLVAWGVFLLALCAIPTLVGESYVYLTTDFLVTALFAMSYNLMLGQAGMLSFGHAAFYGLGAYTVAILARRYHIPLVPGIVVAPLIAGLGALIVGAFTVRLAGMYFAMLTLSFSQLIFAVVSNWYSYTGGDNGLPIEPPSYLASTNAYYYFVLAIVAVAIALLRLLANSPFGSALAAIRENPQRAAFIGLNVQAYQLSAFVIAGALAGVAGALRAALQQMAFPTLLYWTQSADPVLMTLAGGVHTFLGPIVGAAIFVFLNFTVTSNFDYPLLAFGVVVLLLVLFLPEGVVGTAERWRRKRAEKGEPGLDLELAAAPRQPRQAE